METTLLASGWVYLLSITFILVSLLLIGLVLLQKNRGSGLSGAFGGVGGHSAFGTKTGDFLTWFTVGLTGLFLLLAVVGNYVMVPPEAAPPVVNTSTTPPAPSDSGAHAGDANSLRTAQFRTRVFG